MVNNAVTEKDLVVAITRLITTNVGNEAISSEFLSLVEESYPGEQLVFLGRPRGLDRYTMSALEREGDLVRAFDALASNLEQATRRTLNGNQNQGAMNGWTPAVKLVLPSGGHNKARQLKKTLFQPLARRYRKIFRRPESYGSRAQIICRAKTVIYSGAGEVRDGDTMMRQLLELRTAQLAGAAVHVANQGILVEDPQLGRLLGHVYSHANSIAVRGPLSKERLMAFGVNGDDIRVLPDTGFLGAPADARRVAEIQSAEKIRPGTVALAVGWAIAEPIDAWEPVVRCLRDKGKDIILVTSQLSNDGGALRVLSRRYDLRMMSRQYGYRDYIGLLAGCDFIISSRMHTNVFGLMVGVPVIPLEADLFKIHDMSAMLGDYPVSVVDPKAPDWQQQLILSVKAVDRDNNVLRTYLRQKRDEIRAQAIANVIPSAWFPVPSG